MHIMIPGGTGFIGHALVKHFLPQNYTLTLVGRDKNKILHLYGESVRAMTWDELRTQGHTALNGIDLIINLAGASIGDKRWTAKRKQELLDSRIKTTSLISTLCAARGSQSPALFNANGVGVYGLQETAPRGLPPALDEETPVDFEQALDFLSQIGRAWEKATWVARDAGVRVVNTRFGVVLDHSGGVLKRLELPFKLGLGGPLGSGRQPFTWIALADLINALEFLIEHTDIRGPINLTAPQCITQKQFAKALAAALHRPCFMPTPAFVLKLMLGEMADELLLRGQNVAPTRLLNAGFHFKYPEIHSALASIYR